MVNRTALSVACPHSATPQEQRRDPAYLGCGAAEGKPCHWAKRFDGVADPQFHSERLEAALPHEMDKAAAIPADVFRKFVLDTGLV